MASFLESRPTIKTLSSTSTCNPETSRVTHTFKIVGYSMQKGLGSSKFIPSGSFDVGGYEWRILFYPNHEFEVDYVGVYLELLSNNAEVRVHCDFRFMDQTTKSSVSVMCCPAPYLMDTVDRGLNNYRRGSPNFMNKSELEVFLLDDRLVIECDVTVIKDVETTARTTNNMVELPSSPNRPNISQDLAIWLDTKEGADVTFKVEGELFTAHALILAMRSSVFKAQFYGPLREQIDQHITIEDIQPDVFRELLHFIYTDTMSPSMSCLDAAEKKQLLQHLLVAADRYDVQRLKAMCERALCESFDVGTVGAMLALADQQNCRKLKDACIDYIISSADTWDGVAASQEFGNLKRSCPSIVVDILDRAVKSRKI